MRSVALLLLFGGPALAAAQAPRAHLEEALVDFGTITRGAKVERTILFHNLGPADLVIQNIRFSVPALTVRVPRVIPPRGKAALLLDLDTSGFRGDVQAHVVIRTNDPQAATLELHVRGRVDSSVDLLPRPAIFVSAFRWEVDEKESAITVVNRDERPLNIVAMRQEGDGFTARVKLLEEGRRYELAVKLRGTGPSGMGLGRITVSTNRGETITIPVFTLLRDKIYVSPSEIDLGQISLEQVRRHPDVLKFKAETLYVYKYRGEDFRIQVDASASFVIVEKTPPEGAGAMVNIPRQGPTAVFELRVALSPEKLAPGKFEETIRILTNDPEVPEIRVPVSGELN